MKAILRTNNRQTAELIDIIVKSFNGDLKTPKSFLMLTGMKLLQSAI